MRTTYYTKRQLEIFFSIWHVAEKVPAKGKAVVVAFPRSPDYQDEVAKATYTDRKSDSGERLYEVATGTVAEVLGEAGTADNTQTLLRSSIHIVPGPVSP